jgi:sugar-phosphatase
MLLGCDAILSDLDGVLIDSSASIERHWRAWAPRHGLDLARILAVAQGLRTIETMRRVAPDLDWEAEAAAFTAGEVADTEGVRPIAGAAELLAGLPRDGWALVTSATRDLAEARLRRAGLPLPGLMITADDVTQGKPAPECYLLASRSLGVPPQACIVLEDSPAGIEAGQRAGMRVVAVAATSPRTAIAAEAVVADLRALRCCVPPPEGFRLGIEIVQG